MVSSNVSPPSCLINQAVRISRESPSNILNSKNKVMYGTKVGNGGVMWIRGEEATNKPLATLAPEVQAEKEQEPMGPVVLNPDPDVNKFINSSQIMSKKKLF